MMSTSAVDTVDLNPINSKLHATKASASLEASQLARDLKAQGREIISLATGEPDFPTPDHIKQACIAALNANRTGYPPVAGVPELKEAIKAKFKFDNHLDYDVDEILVANGVKQIIFDAFAASLEPYHEVLIPTPGWVSYSEMVRLNDGVPVELPTTWESNFRINLSELEKAINQNTRWLILNNPSNPTGSVFTEAEIRGIADVLSRHPQVMILSDDIYEHIRYGDEPYFTIAQVSADMKKRTLTANGVSKAWCMTGWRVGFAAGPKKLINAMKKLQGQMTGGVMHPAQYGAIAALEGSRDFMVGNLATFRERRDICVDLINKTSGLSCHAPEGAFYLFVNCAGLIGTRAPDGSLIKTDKDLTSFLVEEAGVVCVPGEAFGMSPFFRISFACETSLLKTACLKIQKAVANLTQV